MTKQEYISPYTKNKLYIEMSKFEMVVNEIESLITKLNDYKISNVDLQKIENVKEDILYIESMYY